MVRTQGSEFTKDFEEVNREHQLCFLCIHICLCRSFSCLLSFIFSLILFSAKRLVPVICTSQEGVQVMHVSMLPSPGHDRGTRVLGTSLFPVIHVSHGLTALYVFLTDTVISVDESPTAEVQLLNFAVDKCRSGPKLWPTPLFLTPHGPRTCHTLDPGTPPIPPPPSPIGFHREALGQVGES